MGLLATMACAPILANPPPNLPAFGIMGGSWLMLTMLALLISLFLMVLVYFAGNLLRNQQLIAWTKFELFQIFASALIVMIFTFWLAGICSFDMGFLSVRYQVAGSGGLHGLNMFEVADAYFANLEKLSYLLFGYMMVFGSWISFITNITWISQPMGVGSTETPLQSLGQINNILFMLISGFSLSFMLVQMQQKMIEYIAMSVLYYMMPFGIFFRAFEPTRQFGGTLIGLSIALLFFYPLMLALNDYVVFDPVKDSTNDLSGQLSNINTNSQAGGPTGTQVLTDLPQLAGQDAQKELISGVTGTFFFLLKPLMVYLFAAVILPVINFIVLVETTRALTKTFGEEIDVTNLTRLI